MKDQYEYQAVLDEIHAAGNLTIYCHPDWSGTPAHTFAEMKGNFAMEIWNTGCVVENEMDVDNGLYWDELLMRGVKNLCRRHRRWAFHVPALQGLGLR